MDDAQAKNVRMIFNLFLYGKSVFGIVRGIHETRDAAQRKFMEYIVLYGNSYYYTSKIGSL